MDPVSVTVGDINGDGLPDILYGTGVYNDAVLHTLLAQADGQYIAGTDISVPPSARCILSDLNQDTRLDLICGGYSRSTTGSVVRLLGNGDGTFGPARSFSLPSVGAYPTLKVAAVSDLNHDGHVDLVVTDTVNTRLLILLGDGAGGFPSISEITGYGQDTQAVLSDLDGDGNLDIVSGGTSGVSVYKGHGDGTFGTPAYYSGNGSTVLCDVDGDGHPDLIGGSGGILKILHGNANGSFSANPITSVDFTDGGNTPKAGFGVFLSAYACRDLNGDGLPDILARGDNGLTVLLGQPGLHFATPVSYPVGQDFFTGSYSESLQFVDVNGDGYPDVVAGGPGGVYITYGRADGTFASMQVHASGIAVSEATIADFNEDGNPDVVTSGDLKLQLSLGRGDGTFTTAAPIPWNVGASPLGPSFLARADLVHGDFNGDGHQDLFVTGSPTAYAYNSYLLLGRGDGTFAAPLIFPSSSTDLYLRDQSAVADLNHDGLADVSTSDGQTLRAFLFSGSGQIRTVATTLPAFPGEKTTNYFALADLDGDGLPDLIYTTEGHVGLMRGKGDGTFSGVAFYAIPPLSGKAFQQTTPPVVGDFDGDGTLDVAIAIPFVPAGSTAIYTLPSLAQIFTFFHPPLQVANPLSAFGAAVPGPTPAQPTPYMLANDFDGDGRADLLIADQSLILTGLDPRLSLFHGLAGQSFGPESAFIAGTGVLSLLTGDLDHDGRPDIVASNGDYNAVANAFTVLLNEGSGPFVSGALSATPEPSAFGVPFTVKATFTPSTAGAHLSGSVLFSIDNAASVPVAVTGNAASLVVTSALSAGVHQLTATTTNLTDGTNVYPARTLVSQHTVLPLMVDVTLTASPLVANAGQSISFLAVVANKTNSPSNSPMPAGSLVFSENKIPFASGSVPGTGAAAVSASESFATPGAHAITVTYSGDGIHAAGSASVTVQITATAVSPVDDFKVTLSPERVTVNSGQNASTSVNVSGQGAYKGTLSLSFGPIPTNGSAWLDSASLTLPAGSTANSDFTIQTYSVPPRKAANGNDSPRGAVLLCSVVGLGLLLSRGRRLRFRQLCLMLTCAALFGSTTGCTTAYQPLNLVAPGTYTIPVIATDARTGITHSTALTLVVR